jgi:hypothetical protein
MERVVLALEVGSCDIQGISGASRAYPGHPGQITAAEYKWKLLASTAAFGDAT